MPVGRMTSLLVCLILSACRTSGDGASLETITGTYSGPRQVHTLSRSEASRSSRGICVYWLLLEAFELIFASFCVLSLFVGLYGDLKWNAYGRFGYSKSCDIVAYVILKTRNGHHH